MTRVLRRRTVLCSLVLLLVFLFLLSGCTQDDPGFAVLVTPNGTEVLIDDLTDSITTISFEEHQMHEGNFYFVKGFADGTQTFLFVTPNSAIRADLEFVVASEAEFELSLYEAVTTSADGTGLLAQNANRNSPNAATTELFQGPTLDAVACPGTPVDVLGDGGACGDLIWAGKISAGRAAGTERSLHYELIGKQNTKYWFQFTQIASGTFFVDWDFHWYERE